MSNPLESREDGGWGWGGKYWSSIQLYSVELLQISTLNDLFKCKRKQQLTSVSTFTDAHMHHVCIVFDKVVHLS